MENIECVKYPLRLKTKKVEMEVSTSEWKWIKTWEKVGKYSFLWRFSQENWAIYAVECFHDFNIGWWEINEVWNCLFFNTYV